MRFIVALVLAALSFPLAAAPPADFDARVESLRAKIGVPGMAIAIVENGEATLARGYGVSKTRRVGARRCRHDFPDRLDRQGIHRRGARDAGRCGQDRLGRQGHRSIARLPDVRPVGDARDDDSRSARPSQRSRPGRGRSADGAAWQLFARRGGQATALHQARDELSQRLRLRQRALHGRRSVDRSGHAARPGKTTCASTCCSPRG